MLRSSGRLSYTVPDLIADRAAKEPEPNNNCTGLLLPAGRVQMRRAQIRYDQPRIPKEQDIA